MARVPEAGTIPKLALTPAVWHRRFGHIGLDAMCAALTKDYVQGVEYSGRFTDDKCIPCIFGKEPQRPYDHFGHRVIAMGKLLHTDTSGPYTPPLTRRGHDYFNVVLDDCSNWHFVGIMSAKSEAYDHIVGSIGTVEWVSGNSVVSMRMDGAPEHGKGRLGRWLMNKGISLQVTAPYAHQQNGKAERFIHVLDEGTQAVLADSGLPSSFRGYALHYVSWNRNRLLTSTLPAGITPHEAFKKTKPDLSVARIFGCYCYVAVPPEL